MLSHLRQTWINTPVLRCKRAKTTASMWIEETKEEIMRQVETLFFLLNPSSVV